MPELPEVEAARRILEEHCVGREITLVDAAEDESKYSTYRYEGMLTVCGCRNACDAQRVPTAGCMLHLWR
jgi:hypothetical protein